MKTRDRRCKYFLIIFSALLIGAATNLGAQTIQFRDVTNAAGIPPIDPNGFGHGASFGDFTGDGRPDIYVISYSTANFLLRNDGGTFTDIASSAGVKFPTQSDRGMAAADYDNDGDLDMYIAAGYTGNVLYRNNGNNTFSDVTSSANVNLTGQGQGVAWGDYNKDGRLDLFVAQTDGNNALFRQESNQTFTDATNSTGIGNFSLSLQPVFFDVDNDGDVDLFVARKESQANLLYINNGNGTFTERAGNWGITNSSPHDQGAAIGDYDRDGDLDIYICNYDGFNQLFRNNGNSFSEVANAAGVLSGFAGNRGALFGDFNDDGWLDIYVTRNDDNKMYQNNGDGTFTDVSSASGTANTNSGYSPSLADYDNDGDLDIFFTNTGQNSVLYQNLGPFNNWLQIKLVGNASNRDGVGAKLTGWLGGQRQTQVIIAGQAYLCTGSDLTAHFALAASNKLDSLIVQWPSGTRDRFTNLSANQKLTLTEGSGGGPDTTPPVISNVTAENLTTTSATISWQTDEAADSQVEYGLTTSYGISTPLDVNLVTSHSVILSGLQANTIYHYRVKSKDASGNLAISNDFTFSTPASDPIFSDNFNTSTLDLTKWNKGSNSGNQSAVVSNQLQLQSSGSVSGWVITKNSFVAKNTTVSVKVTTLNNDGDLGMSPTYTLSSPFGVYNENNWYRFYVYRSGSSGPYRLYAEWKKNGVNNGLDVTGNLVINGVIFLRLRFGNTNIHFEASLDGAAWTDTYTEAFGLPGYTLNSAFYYELSGYNTNANGVLKVDDFAINGSAPIPDTQPPQISAVTAQNISSNSAQIVWQTDETADSQVEYGLTMSYGISTPLDATPLTSHSVALSGLQANTIYHYRVKSKDAAGNLATSGDFTFTTLPPSSAIFADDFNVAALDLNKWNKGSNSGNQSAVISNQLQLQSSGSVSGWVITKNSYAARNTAVSVKVTQPNNDGDLGVSPTYNLSSTLGIFNENNWYRFYVYGSGPYRLFAQWKKSGSVNGVDVTGSLVINGAVYLRLRFDNTNIHFEASLDGVNWTDTYTEAFGLPGYTLDSSFYYELAAYKTTSNGMLKVDDFAINGSTPIPDTQPPQISAVTAQNISSSGAQIVWQTDESSDSQVEYGLTTSYGLSTPLDAALITSHAVALSGLQTNTLYHYRVKSKDAAGNLATSGDFTFTTLPPSSAIFADDFNVAALDLTKWNKGSNSGNQSAVVSNQLELRSSGSVSGWVITKNNYTAANTVVQVKVTRPNNDGDLGISPTYTLSSPFGIFNENNWYRFYVYRNGGSGPYLLFAQWKKNGVDGGLDVTGNLVINGAVYLRLRFDNANIHFEASLDGAVWTDTYTESFGLPGYTLNSAFYYELAAYKTGSNGALQVDDFSINANATSGLAAKSAASGLGTSLLPVRFALQNYPNPFNAATRIRFDLPQHSEVELNIFDLAGREALTLRVGRFAAGNHEVIWNGRHRDGAELSSGIYLLRLRYRADQTTNWSQLVRRVMLVK